MDQSLNQATGISRRNMLHTGAAMAAGATVLPLNMFAQTPPSERIAIGVIGLGGRSIQLINDLLRQPDAQIVMLCDVDKVHYRDQEWGKGIMYGREGVRQYVEKKLPGNKGIAVTDDFGEVCGSDQVDAVVIATPDHWHALCTLEAIRNGKDVYCEKPVTHTFAEGKTVYNDVAKRKTVFQTGSQQRSMSGFRQAVELIRNGHIGALKRIEIGLNPGYERPMSDTSTGMIPVGLDYEMWCGPAPKLPYMRARHHRWWRGHRAFGGGVLMDWIGHHNDIAHWAMDLDHSGPVEVKAVNWQYPESQVYDTPYRYEVQCRYANGVLTSIDSHRRNGILFHGEKGRIFVNRGGVESSDKRLLAKNFDPGPEKVYRSDDHMRNFLDCIKSRKNCIAPSETAHRSITPGHLAYLSHTLGRTLKWDPVSETVPGDDEANRLLLVNKYRHPWG